MKTGYLIDESIIVFLEREGYEYHTQLVAFLEDGKLAKSLNARKHVFYMPYSSRCRLGNFRFYKTITNAKKLFRNRNNITEPILKAETRSGMANEYVYKYYKAPCLTRIYRFWKRKKIIDLFIYSNDKKSTDIQRENGERMKSPDVIPLEMCEIAMIANKHNLTIVSFNKDYQYLMRIPGMKKQFVRYVHPDDLLKDYFGKKN